MLLSGILYSKIRPLTPSTQQPCEVHPVGNPVGSGAAVVVVVVMTTGGLVVVETVTGGAVVVPVPVVEEDTGGAGPTM